MTAIKTTAEIKKELSLIKVAGQKLDDRIHAAACDVADHMAKHNDVTLVNALYLCLPRGARASAMAEWILGCMAVVANTGPTKKEVPFVYSKEKKTDPELARATPWYEMKKDPTPDMLFDFRKAMAAVLKKAQKSGVVMGATPEQMVALATMAGMSEADIVGIRTAKDKAEADAILAQTAE